MSTPRTRTTGRTAIQCAASENHPEEDDLLTDIFNAYLEARKSKRNSSPQVRFERALSDNIIALYNEISTFRYKVGRCTCFIINDPVKREVFAASFRDRIVHHLLFNWLSPIFEPTFIYDSYSCRQGKGTLFGIKRLEHHIRSCSDNYKNKCFVLKLDIEGYFMNINRELLYNIIVCKIESFSRKHSLNFNKKIAIYLLHQIIFTDPVRGCYRKGNICQWNGLPRSKSLFYAPSGCGLPIGNLTSQLFSNVYLSKLDDYIKRNLKFAHYGRYVDDFFIVSNSKEELLQSIPKIRSFLMERLGLSLHPRKVYLAPIEYGVKFLGVVIKPNGRYLSRSCKIRMKRHICNLLTDEENPYIISATIESYRGYLSHIHSSLSFDG